MFVFMLITAELAILYTAFWYLYLRQPKQARRIQGGNWGSYENPVTVDGAGPEYAAVQQFMVPVPAEMVLDLRTNHYVPLPKRKGSVLDIFVRQLDDRLSELNVKA